MSANRRQWLFFPAAVLFSALFLRGLSGLAAFGQIHGAYGTLLNAVTVSERHLTDVVTAVNFDYRGFDTLGEEYILFSSIMGVLLLLRRQPDEIPRPPEDEAPGRDVPRTSGAVRVIAVGLVGLMVLSGINVVVHGHLTPGGGFQGGVIVATAALLIYLGGEFETFARMNSRRLVELAEATGAGTYILVGLAGAVFGNAFLENVLPLGQVGSVVSSGTVWLLNVAVGLAVSAGLVLLSLAFLEETLVLHRRSGS
jgi:multicomponent Na+:H+ antiporter subunit B